MMIKTIGLPLPKQVNIFSSSGDSISCLRSLIYSVKGVKTLTLATLSHFPKHER